MYHFIYFNMQAILEVNTFVRLTWEHFRFHSLNETIERIKTLRIQNFIFAADRFHEI